MAEDSKGSGDGPAVGGPEPALRGGGLPLPGLKHWRLRRNLSQTELARRADLKDGYIARVESGRRGCNPETARLLADLLKVDLRDLRRNYDDAAQTGAPPRHARPRIAYRHVHQAYLEDPPGRGGGLRLRGDGRMGDREALRREHVGRRPRGRPGEEAGDRVPRGGDRGRGECCRTRTCPRRCARSWRRC